jgi:hypothetical protein
VFRPELHYITTIYHRKILQHIISNRKHIFYRYIITKHINLFPLRNLSIIHTDGRCCHCCSHGSTPTSRLFLRRHYNYLRNSLFNYKTSLNGYHSEFSLKLNSNAALRARHCLTRDFCPQVIFHKSVSPWPLSMLLGSLRFFSKFAEIIVNGCCSAVSMTPAIKEKNFQV